MQLCVVGDNSWWIKNEKGRGAAGKGLRKPEYKWHHRVDTINHRDNVASTPYRSLDNNLASLCREKRHLNTIVVFPKTIHSFHPLQLLFFFYLFAYSIAETNKAQAPAGYKDGGSHRNAIDWFANAFSEGNWFNDQRFIDIFR